MKVKDLIKLLKTVDEDNEVTMSPTNDINETNHLLIVDSATINCGRENTIALIPGPDGVWRV